jgi:hypothetical protein
MGWQHTPERAAEGGFPTDSTPREVKPIVAFYDEETHAALPGAKIPFCDFQIGQAVQLRSTDDGPEGIVVGVKTFGGQPVDVKVRFLDGSCPWFPPSHLRIVP